MAGPDLTFAQQKVAGLMDDTCRISRDVERAGDDVLDPVTGRLVPPSPDTTIIYEGPCTVRTSDTDEYTVSIPADSPIIRIHDRINVLTSRRDPDLVGRRMVVTSLTRTSWLVSRKMTAQDPTQVAGES